MGCAESSIELPGRGPTSDLRQSPFVVEIPKPQVKVGSISIDNRNREVLYGIIQRDSEKEFALCLDKWKIPVNAEIEYPGTYWTLMHLCARWNAVKCLSFVLRRYYQQHAADYIKFVNIQTNEGYTPLMLSVIWDAQECFELLLNWGGNDLSLRDALGADTLHHAYSHRREKMQQTLKSFRQNHQMMISVNTGALQPTASLDAMLISVFDLSQKAQASVPEQNLAQQQQQLQKLRVRQEQIRRKNQEELAILAETHRKDQERIALERKRIADEQQKLRETAVKQMQDEMDNIKRKRAEQQLQLQQFEQQELSQQRTPQQNIKQGQRAQEQRKMKEQQPRQREDFEQQMLQQQTQQETALQEKKQLEEAALQLKAEEQRLLEEQGKVQEQEAQKKQAEYIERQRQLQMQKEDELKKIVEEQKRAEEQRIRNLQKANEQKKLEQQRQLQAKLQSQETQRRIAEQRELLEKSLEQQRRKAEQNIVPIQTVVVNSGASMVCPADVKPLYESVVAKRTNFIDEKFPPKLQTIGDKSKLKSNMHTSVWLRPQQIFKKGYELFNGIDPNDIKQGSLGVCYYLSTLSSLAEKEGRIRCLFPFYDKQLGFYVVKLNIHGKPTSIVVDDFLPCFRSTKEPMFTKPNGNQIWVMILEKAWVKNFGSYLAAESMAPNIMMEDVCGAPTKGVWIKDPAKEFENLLVYDRKNYIMVLTSVSENVPKGIVAKHVYSLLQVFSFNGVNLYKIRNPWGHFEWDGAYSSNSKKWTPELKKAVNYVEADDGIFYMTPDELTLGFNYYSVGMIKEDYIYSHFEFTSEPLEDVYFSFTVKQKGELNLRLCQRFHRLMNDPDYAYSPFILEVGRINGPDSAALMGEGENRTAFGDKSVHHHEDVYRLFDAGNYFIRARMLWKSKVRQAVLVGYAAQPLQFATINGQQGRKYWKNMARNVISAQQKTQLAPGVSYAQIWMRGQYIFYAENTSNRTYEFIVKFVSNEFVNCRLGMNKSTDAEMKFVLPPANGWDIGTIEKIEPSQACKIGKLTFQTRPV